VSLIGDCDGRRALRHERGIHQLGTAERKSDSDLLPRSTLNATVPVGTAGESATTAYMGLLAGTAGQGAGLVKTREQ